MILFKSELQKRTSDKKPMMSYFFLDLLCIFQYHPKSNTHCSHLSTDAFLLLLSLYRINSNKLVEIIFRQAETVFGGKYIHNKNVDCFKKITQRPIALSLFPIDLKSCTDHS